MSTDPEYEALRLAVQPVMEAQALYGDACAAIHQPTYEQASAMVPGICDALLAERRKATERAAMRALLRARVDALRPQPCWEAINPYVECKDNCQRCKALAVAEALVARLSESASGAEAAAESHPGIVTMAAHSDTAITLHPMSFEEAVIALARVPRRKDSPAAPSRKTKSRAGRSPAKAKPRTAPRP